MKVVFIWIEGLERVSLVYSALVELNFTILHHNSLVVKRLTILNIITQFFFLVQVCRTREIASRAEQQTKATRRGQAKAQVRDDFTLIKHCRLLTLHWLQQHRLALQSYFDRRGNSLRGHLKVVLPRPTSSYMQHSFTYQAGKQWNSLPDKIRMSESLSIFRKNLQNIQLSSSYDCNCEFCK